MFPTSPLCPRFPRPPRAVRQADTTVPQDTLSYGCICGDGNQPNMTQYTLTLPYYTCTEYGNQCVEACEEHDNACASACRQDNPCGAQDPEAPSGTASAAKPTATDDDDEDELFDGLDGAEDTGAAGRVELGRAYGLFAVLGGLFVGFSML